MSAPVATAGRREVGSAAPARRLLVINPNTTASITDLLLTHVRAVAGDRVVVSGCTARFGAPYISDETSYAIAGHAALDAWTAANEAAEACQADGTGDADNADATSYDAVLIGCFGDPGLFALRESSGVPVTGLAEAAFVEAAKHGRFAIVTGGAKWDPILRRLAMALGYDATLAGIRTAALTGAQLMADRTRAIALLGAKCEEAARDFDAQAVILGGAGLAGMAAELSPAASRAGVTVIDSVVAGAIHALRLAG